MTILVRGGLGVMDVDTHIWDGCNGRGQLRGVGVTDWVVFRKVLDFREVLTF